MKRITLGGLGICVGLVACGGAAKKEAVTPTAAQKADPASHAGAAAAAPDNSKAEMLSMVRDLLVPQLCERIRGSFIALPAEGASNGPQAGLAAAVGRWHIEDCHAHTKVEVVSLRLVGLGWTWVERHASGFKMQQYLFFDAEASLQTTFDIGYDPATKIASLWMQPQAGVQARITPRGTLSAQATNIFAAIVGGVLGLTGSSVDATARKQVEQEGSKRLREQLAGGFTATWDLKSQQMDFMVGRLAKGQVPLRPSPEATGGVWQVNGRSRIWPKGIDVIGPFSQQHMPRTLHVVLEQGEAVQLSALCADAFVDYLKRRAQGEALEPPLGKNLAAISTLGRAQPIALPAMSCPLAVVLAPQSQAQLPIQVRYRDGAPTTLDTSIVQPTVTPRPVRLQLLDVHLQWHDADRAAWDVWGGKADIFLVTTNQRSGREVDRTHIINDRNHAVFKRWLPGTYGKGELPLRLVVYDKDPTRDEPVGAAVLDAPALDALTQEVILPIHALSARAKQVGVIRLRIQRTGSDPQIIR